MFRLDNILEPWAELYKPLSHNGQSSMVRSTSGRSQGENGQSSTANGQSSMVNGQSSMVNRQSSMVNGRKSFFRISMIDANSYFVRNYNSMDGCVMAYATHIDAELERNPNFINYRHVIYFLVKQQNAPQKTNVTDELAATEARYDTDEMVQDLLVFLDRLQTAANNGKSELTVAGHSFPITSDIRQGLRGLKLNEAHWGTLPTMFNGWQICGLTIEQASPRLLCINEEKYI